MSPRDTNKQVPHLILVNGSLPWKRRCKALRENGTFELTPLPEDRKTVGGQWVYAVKQGPNGEEKHKARFLAKGYSQVAEIDYQ